MAASLAVGLVRPSFLFVLPKILVWLVPVWIGILFLVQTLTAPDPTGRATPGGAADRRPWRCEVCETENEPEAVTCSRCTVPRPEVRP